jgi:2-dehydro-3-deoxyphosphogluconate aldolase / (4S)-4-hydroxy-2-oxoglutarate aldolase
MNKPEVIARIRECGVLPVIRASSAEEARSIIDAIAAGGVTTIEVTMTVPNAVDLIGKLSKEREDLLIGAGSVLDPETARECINAGAKFIISPATNFETIEYCNDKEIVVMPGALTPTEILNATEAGADIVKVFPADAMGGAKYLRSLKAPMPHLKLIPTGGVNQSTAGEFIRAGAEAIGIGTDLVDLHAIREGRAGEITDAARKYLEIVRAERTM